MTAGSILACRDARAPHWQLGPLPPDRGRLTLIAWTPGVETHDGGVPPDVAGVLARSWTAIARVTFPSSVVKRAPARGRLTTTRQPDVVSRAFEDPGFPWWLQGQAMLLSDPDADPPDVDEATLLTLFDGDWARRAAALESVGVQGAVRPGVDGDVAGVLAWSDPFDARLLESLERETRRAGMLWTVVSEAVLSQKPLGGLPHPPQR